MLVGNNIMKTGHLCHLSVVWPYMERSSYHLTDRFITFLAARSPVFNAMFEHEMEESKKVRM